MLLVWMRLMVLMLMMRVLTFMTRMMILIMTLMMILTTILRMIITDDDTDDDTDDGGRGNLYTIKLPGCCSWVPGPCGPWSLVFGPSFLLLCGLAQKSLCT